MHRALRLTRQFAPASTSASGFTHSHHRFTMSATAAATSASSVATATSSAISTTATPRTIRVAAIQMSSSDDQSHNIESVTRQIREAAKSGAKLICTPENTHRMAAITQKAVEKDETTATAAASATTSSSTHTTYFPDSHPVLLAFQSLAAELQVHLLLGSIQVRVEGEARLANRSYLIGPDVTKPSQQSTPTTTTTSSSSSSSSSSTTSPPLGRILAEYTKIHLFDVPQLGGTGPGAESYLESARIVPGAKAVVVKTPSLAVDASIGMSICYDLRFAALYRALAKEGKANIITIPSAFTVPTGEAHWHVLLRARAIETGAFIIAPAQCGTHAGGRKTYGHSLIVSPWGTIIAEANGSEPEILIADIDLNQCEEARRRVPSLTHDRPFTLDIVEP